MASAGVKTRTGLASICAPRDWSQLLRFSMDFLCKMHFDQSAGECTDCSTARHADDGGGGSPALWTSGRLRLQPTPSVRPEMCLFGAFRRQKVHFQKLEVPNRFCPKSKVPKWVCRWTLAIFCNGPPFFAIFGPARGQIYKKKAEKIVKDALVTLFLEWG